RSDWMRASISASHAQSSDDPSQVSFTGLATIDADVDLLLPDPSGVFKYIPIPDPTDPFANPLNQQRYPHSQIKRDRTLLNATVEFKLFPFLSVGGSGSYDRGNWHQFATIPKGTPTLSGQGSSSGSQQTARDTSNGSLLQAGATVQKTFGALQSRLALRAEKQQQTYSSFQRVGTSFNDQGVPQVNSETYSNNKVETSALIAKPMLDYSGKYVVEALLRREKPGGNFSHESFSRVSVAWLLNEEHWFPFSDLSLVKLHAAAGASTFHQNSQQYAQLDPSPPIGNPYSLALQDPGKTTEHEFGIAIAPRNRWQVSLVYATSNTKGASLAASTSPCIVCSASNPVANLAGHTAEATVQARILQRTKFTWDIALVGDRRRSTIEESLRTCYTDFLQRVCNNIDIGTMQGHHLARDKRELVGVQASSLGAFDINDEGYVVPVGSGNSFRDGKSKNLWGTNVTVDGRTFGWGLPMTAYDENGLQVESQIGDGNPDLQFGFQNNIQYRSLRLYAQIAGQFGGDVYNNRKQALYASGDHVDLDQSSKPDELRKSRSYYRALANGNADYLSNFVESATHARLAEASVGYEFKAGTSGLLKRIGASRVQVDLVGRNLFTITGYSGLNPMGSSAASREDNILYPLVRTFSLATIIVF
ncbi:MAG: hypothetical protein ABJB74_09655, partial [Gemmatimonas sp.]